MNNYGFAYKFLLSSESPPRELAKEKDKAKPEKDKKEKAGLFGMLGKGKDKADKLVISPASSSSADVGPPASGSPSTASQQASTSSAVQSFDAKAFEALLDELGLSGAERTKMLALPEKNKILLLQEKRGKAAAVANSPASPSSPSASASGGAAAAPDALGWVEKLRVRDLSELTRLRVQLCSCALPWLMSFIKAGGHIALLSLLPANGAVRGELVRCIRGLMNAQAGLQAVLNEGTILISSKSNREKVFISYFVYRPCC